MKGWKVWSGLVLLFFSGVLIGALGTGIYVKHTIEQISEGEKPPFQKPIMWKLTRELTLTDQQRAEVEKVVCKAQEELFKIRMAHQPEVEELLSRSVATIKPLLQPHQQEKLDALHERATKRLKQRRERHPEGRGLRGCD